VLLGLILGCLGASWALLGRILAMGVFGGPNDGEDTSSQKVEKVVIPYNHFLLTAVT
jgi:hypothetical protein